jgi:hypothetical protein
MRNGVRTDSGNCLKYGWLGFEINNSDKAIFNSS